MGELDLPDAKGGTAMSAPSKAYWFLLVTCLRATHRQEVQLGQRLATSPTPSLTFREATN